MHIASSESEKSWRAKASAFGKKSPACSLFENFTACVMFTPFGIGIVCSWCEFGSFRCLASFTTSLSSASLCFFLWVRKGEREEEREWVRNAKAWGGGD